MEWGCECRTPACNATGGWRGRGRVNAIPGSDGYKLIIAGGDGDIAGGGDEGVVTGSGGT